MLASPRRRLPDVLGNLRIDLHLGIRHRRLEEGCVATATARKKQADRQSPDP
jgi:hypothetical protein